MNELPLYNPGLAWGNKIIASILSILSWHGKENHRFSSSQMNELLFNNPGLALGK